jgi:hypothetical protein
LTQQHLLNVDVARHHLPGDSSYQYTLAHWALDHFSTVSPRQTTSRFDIPRRVKTRTIISVSEGTPAMAIIKSNATVTDAMTSDLSALAEAGDNPVEVQGNLTF